MTRKSIALPFMIAVLAAIVAAGFFAFGNPTLSEAKGGPASPQRAVALVGIDAEAFPSDSDPAFALAPAGSTCFNVDLVDLKTNKVIGGATDCILPFAGGPESGIQLTGTTFFNFPEGTLVSQGTTTVQPLEVSHDDLPLEVINGSTHATASPAPVTPGSSNIISGTGAFKKAYEDGVGTVRLSGLVNLTRLFEPTLPDGDDGFIPQVSFDCIFVIDLDGLPLVE